MECKETMLLLHVHVESNTFPANTSSCGIRFVEHFVDQHAGPHCVTGVGVVYPPIQSIVLIWE